MAKSRFANALGLDDLPDKKAWEEPDAWLTGWELFPRQQEFDDAIWIHGKNDIGFGGAPGPGKSTILALEGFKYALKFPMAEIGCVRNNKKDLNTSLWRHIVAIASRLKEQTGLDYSKSDEKLVLFNGPDNSEGSVFYKIEGKDTNKIQGANLDVILIDEAVQVPVSAVTQLLQRLRGSINNPGTWPLLFLWASNPGVGWPKSQYVDLDKKGMLGDRAVILKGEVVDLSKRAFVRATCKDNPMLPDDYAARILAADNSAETRALLAGDWDYAQGQVYTFPDKYIQKFEPSEIFPGETYYTAARIGGYDWGVSHDTAILVGAIATTLMDGVVRPRLYLWGEYVQSGNDVSYHIEWMAQFPNAIWFVDQSIFRPCGHVGKIQDYAIANEFAGSGVSIIPANEGPKNNTAKGIQVVRQLYSMGALIIHPSLGCLIEGMANYSYKANKHIAGEFIKSEFELVGEDVCDALRYLCINAAPALQVEGKDLTGKGPKGDSCNGSQTKEQLVASQNRRNDLCKSMTMKPTQSRKWGRWK